VLVRLHDVSRKILDEGVFTDFVENALSLSGGLYVR